MPTKMRYEIKDSHAPMHLRGQRFSSLPRAIRELSHCVGAPRRWQLIDRETGECLGTN